ncbi:MAG: hypothetical protein GKR96_11820 [Gammaproteobacteria bacterium]|nr:hypothetical protein [Gammaproteobacteria bacterium]
MSKFSFIALLLTSFTVTADEQMIGAGHVSVSKEQFLQADIPGKAEMLCAGCHGEEIVQPYVCNFGLV